MTDVSLGRARRARIIRSAGNQCFASLIIPTLLGDFYLTSKKSSPETGKNSFGDNYLEDNCGCENHTYHWLCLLILKFEKYNG